VINERMQQLAGVPVNEKRLPIAPIKPKWQPLDTVQRSQMSYIAQEFSKWFKRESGMKLSFEIKNDHLLLDTLMEFGNTIVFVDHEGKYYIRDYWIDWYGNGDSYEKTYGHLGKDPKEIVKILTKEPFVSIDLGTAKSKRIDRANKTLGRR
jgi:hypothetical protein